MFYSSSNHNNTTTNEQYTHQMMSQINQINSMAGGAYSQSPDQKKYTSANYNSTFNILPQNTGKYSNNI